MAETKALEVSGIVKKYLDDNGYDGLCNPDIECGCGKDDLAPCGCDRILSCVPAYFHDCGNCEKNEGSDYAGCYTTSKTEGCC